MDDKQDHEYHVFPWMAVTSSSSSPHSWFSVEHLLLKVVVDEEQDSIIAVHDTFGILIVLQDVPPEHNTFTSLGDLTGGDGGDFIGSL